MVSLLDFYLFFLYNKKFHPWSAILAEENRKSDQNKREGFAPDFAPSEMGKVLFKQDIEYWLVYNSKYWMVIEYIATQYRNSYAFQRNISKFLNWFDSYVDFQKYLAV